MLENVGLWSLLTISELKVKPLLNPRFIQWHFDVQFLFQCYFGWTRMRISYSSMVNEKEKKVTWIVELTEDMLEKLCFIVNVFLLLLASAPDFSKSPVKKLIQLLKGSTAHFECNPKASPKATTIWKKGGELLHENERYYVVNVFLL